MSFLKSGLGRDIFSIVEEKAQSATMQILKDKQGFVERESQRKSFLEQDKLVSMKKIVEYEGLVEAFPQKQDKLVTEIEMHKTAASLLQDTLNGLYKDKLYMSELRTLAEEGLPGPEEEEPEAELDLEAEEPEEQIEEEGEELINEETIPGDEAVDEDGAVDFMDGEVAQLEEGDPQIAVEDVGVEDDQVE